MALGVMDRFRAMSAFQAGTLAAKQRRKQALFAEGRLNLKNVKGFARKSVMGEGKEYQEGGYFWKRGYAMALSGLYEGRGMFDSFRIAAEDYEEEAKKAQEELLDELETGGVVASIDYDEPIGPEDEPIGEENDDPGEMDGVAEMEDDVEGSDDPGEMDGVAEMDPDDDGLYGEGTSGHALYLEASAENADGVEEELDAEFGPVDDGTVDDGEVDDGMVDDAEYDDADAEA